MRIRSVALELCSSAPLGTVIDQAQDQSVLLQICSKNNEHHALKQAGGQGRCSEMKSVCAVKAADMIALALQQGRPTV